MDKDYYTTKIVIKSDENVLYGDASKILFSDNVENYFYKILFELARKVTLTLHSAFCTLN